MLNNQSVAGLGGAGNGNITTDIGGFAALIPDYRNTNKRKSAHSIGNNSFFDARIYGASWNNTSAISVITLNSNGCGNILVGTKISLYGIKG